MERLFEKLPRFKSRKGNSTLRVRSSIFHSVGVALRWTWAACTLWGAPPRLPALELPAGPRGRVTFRWGQPGLSFHRAVRLLLVGEIVQMMEQSDLSVKDAAVDTL